MDEWTPVLQQFCWRSPAVLCLFSSDNTAIVMDEEVCNRLAARLRCSDVLVKGVARISAPCPSHHHQAVCCSLNQLLLPAHPPPSPPDGPRRITATQGAGGLTLLTALFKTAHQLKKNIKKMDLDDEGSVKGGKKMARSRMIQEI